MLLYGEEAETLQVIVYKVVIVLLLLTPLGGVPSGGVCSCVISVSMSPSEILNDAQE